MLLVGLCACCCCTQIIALLLVSHPQLQQETQSRDLPAEGCIPVCVSHRVGADNVIASDVRTSRRMLDAGPFRSAHCFMSTECSLALSELKFHASDTAVRLLYMCLQCCQSEIL